MVKIGLYLVWLLIVALVIGLYFGVESVIYAEIGAVTSITTVEVLEHFRIKKEK